MALQPTDRRPTDASEDRTRDRVPPGRSQTGALRWLITLLLVCVVLPVLAADTRKWKPLADDGLHDRDNPALGSLQNPADALRLLPPNSAGNQVDWVKALRDGYIKPRTQLLETTKVRTLDTHILMKRTAEMPYVNFPHLPHTEWLDCGNCHESLFKSKAGATPVNMFAILQGEYCGRCHGAVSFPLTECNRCHSVPRSSVSGNAPSGATGKTAGDAGPGASVGPTTGAPIGPTAGASVSPLAGASVGPTAGTSVSLPTGSAPGAHAVKR